MGKGTIVSGGTDGLYQIDYEVDKTRMQAKIDELVNAIEILTEVDIPAAEADVAAKQTEHSNLLMQLNAAIQASNDTAAITKSLSIALSELNAATGRLNSSKLKLGSLTQEKKFLTDNLPPDEEIAAWCADLNESLSGEVGTIEVPGERTSPVIIRPGGESGNDAAYDAAADGQIIPVLGLSPSVNFYNLAIMPGWQKYQPTYRLGEITNLAGNLCDITLDAAVSSLQGLDVNASATLTDVPITYLTCDGAAFEVGDRVIVKYTGSGPGTPYTPSVIGFETNPKACCTAGFTADVLSGSAPLTVQFTASETGTCGFDNWLWDFGDNQFSFEENPTHIYRDTGTFDVKLKAWKGTGSPGGVGTNVREVKSTQTSGVGITNAAAHAQFLSQPWITVSPVVATQTVYHLSTRNPISHPLDPYWYNAIRTYRNSIDLTSFDKNTTLVVAKVTEYELAGSLNLESGIRASIGGVEQGKSYRQDVSGGVDIPLGDLTDRIGTSGFDVLFDDLGDYPILTEFPYNSSTGWNTEPSVGGRVAVNIFQYTHIGIKLKENYITVT